MDIYIFAIILMLSIFGIVVYLLLQSFWKKENCKLELIANMLNTKMIKRWLGFETVIEGYYKGRKIIFNYWVASRADYLYGETSGGATTAIFIIPNAAPQTTNKISVEPHKTSVPPDT